MPLYCYRGPSGIVLERYYPIAEGAPKRIRCGNGEWAKRSLRDEGQRTRGRGVAGHWPHASVSCGVNPDQIPTMLKQFPHHRFSPDGRQVFDNPAHMRRCLDDIGATDHGSTP